MDNISNLNHVTVKTDSDASIFVLNRGSLISSEAEAMLQALHSRSTSGFLGHLKILNEKGSDKFMSTFYVGYGHKSIGDCGTCVLFIENISMLAAKAVQDWPLYRGQEASTRYIDFSNQKFYSPNNTKEETELLEYTRDFYIEFLPKVEEYLKNKHPLKENEKPKTWAKAIKARAFDVCRGFLPAGATTNIAWSTDLRQASDKLVELRHHPLKEVREIAEGVEKALIKAYPNSFHHKKYEETENYVNDYMKTSLHSFEDKNNYTDSYLKFETDGFNIKSLLNNQTDLDVIKNRPKFAELPRNFRLYGTFNIEFTLDFGSYRDLQRHRAVYMPLPELNTNNFEGWYLNILNEELKTEASAFLSSYEEKLNQISISNSDKQYLTLMGYQVSVAINGDLKALLYLLELRASRHVHSTLRQRVFLVSQKLKKYFQDNGINLNMHLDSEDIDFDTKRGEHDIVINNS